MPNKEANKYDTDRASNKGAKEVPNKEAKKQTNMMQIGLAEIMQWVGYRL